MNISAPQTQLGTTTPLADSAAGAVGVAVSAAHTDHAHPGSTGYVAFQNAGDLGKKLQQIESGTISATTADGALFIGSASVSWPATFASAPVAVTGALPNGANGAASSQGGALTTTAIQVKYLATLSSGSAGNVFAWALG